MKVLFRFCKYSASIYLNYLFLNICNFPLCTGSYIVNFPLLESSKTIFNVSSNPAVTQPSMDVVCFVSYIVEFGHLVAQ